MLCRDAMAGGVWGLKWRPKISWEFISSGAVAKLPQKSFLNKFHSNSAAGLEGRWQMLAHETNQVLVFLPRRALGPSFYMYIFYIFWITSVMQPAQRITHSSKIASSGKKRVDRHKFFGPVALGTTLGLSQGQTGLVPGTNPLCPMNKPRFSLYFTQWTQFVPRTNPVRPWDNRGDERRQRKLAIGDKISTYRF